MNHFHFRNYVHFVYVTGIANSSFAMLHRTYFPILVDIIKMEIDYFEIETSSQFKLNLNICTMNAILVYIMLPFENSNKIPVLQR